MDAMVYKTQQWLNDMYSNKPGYNEIDLTDENIKGRTGWTTIYALTRAFQIELGITQTADNFGPSTTRLFQDKFGNGIAKPENEDSVCGKYGGIYGIIQGALWCKGYPAHYGGITTNFDSGTASGIKKLKADAGIDSTNETVTLNVMKSLLSMKQYVLVSNGSASIRAIQRYFNGKYEDYIGLAPCDGLYGRDMCRAMIKVLQAIEGFSVEDATGNFGNGTKSRLPILPHESNPDATYLFRAALCCNGYNVDIGTEWDNYVQAATLTFQNDMKLPQSGEADVDTWMALMVSSGNSERSSNGCDTRFEMTDERISILKDNQYEVVGRYLTGGDFKELRAGEPERILKNGLKFFPIFQESGADLNYFTPVRGKIDAEKSSKAARKFGLPKDTIIYFAVDTDPLDTQISNRIIPYFESLHEHFDPYYQIGIYGTRNACTQVSQKGYSIASFVADMSSGFSGNMGFKIPENWNFDQYYEIKISESGWDFDLDKTTYSGRFPVVDHLEHRNYVQPQIPSVSADMPSILSFVNILKKLEDCYIERYNVPIDVIPSYPLELVLAITNFLRSQQYFDQEWEWTTGSAINTDFVSHIQTDCPDIYNYMTTYIREGRLRKPISDGQKGIIDLAHFAATLEVYLTSSFIPDFWASWGGDLATGMSNTTSNIQSQDDESSIYYKKSIQEIADATIGKEGTDCNYSDLCSDFDAYKIAQILKKKCVDQTDKTGKILFLSDILQQFYTEHTALYSERFHGISEELGCSNTVGSLSQAINDKMHMVIVIGKPYLEFTKEFTILGQKGGNPSEEVVDACCNSFANYICTMLDK